MEQNEKCIKARLMASMEDGAYTIYVFEDLLTGEFHMVKRPPNWEGTEPDELQEGFLTYKSVQAGIDKYYSNELQRFVLYQYDGVYFHTFVPITRVLKDGFVVNKGEIIVR